MAREPKVARPPGGCRRRRRELRAGTYAAGGIQWHGVHVGQPDFSENSRLVAWSLGSQVAPSLPPSPARNQNQKSFFFNN